MVQDDAKTSSSVGDRFHEARSVIDRDIAQLEEAIRALKSHRNDLSPICRLPPEILCNIFSFIEDRTLGTSQKRPDSWISFSRVSQQWRSLALSAPELWTNLPFQYPRWTQEMLRRSKMATLTVQVDFSYQAMISRSLDSIKSCLSHMIRLGEINITTVQASTLEKLFQDLPKSAPQLHTFRISSNPLGGSAFTIPEDFLADTERLQCIHLVKCKIGWDSPLLTGLVRLTLHDSLKDNASTIQFLHALQRMPALTDLDLQNSIPYDSGETSTYPIVELPCLRVLRISSDVGEATTVLRHITFPSSVLLNLTCKETHSAKIDFSKFLSLLATKFLSSLVIRSLIVTDLQNGLRFEAWPTALRGFFYIPPCQLNLVLTWPTLLPPNEPQNHAKVLIAVFDSMTLHALTNLQLSTSHRIDSKTLLKTFARPPLLERVNVTSDAAHSFFTALIHKTKAANKSITAYRTVSFPRLRCIYLDGTDFTGVGTNLGSISAVMLMDCLMERCERNAEVQELHLENCYNLFEDDVEGLREVVVNVDWDEVEQTFSESEEEIYYDSDGNTIDDFASDDYYDYDDFPAGYGRPYWL